MSMCDLDNVSNSLCWTVIFLVDGKDLYGMSAHGITQ